MAFGNKGYENKDEFFYTMEDNFDYVIEEKSNQFTALRKIDWGNTGTYRLDLRKYYSTTDGGEKMGKGMSFLTEEGPAELTKVLLSLGYADTTEVLECIKDREDFRASLNSVLKDKNDEFYDEKAGNSKSNYYDPKELLL